MRSTAFLIRFFLVVPPVPALMALAFAASVACGGVALALHATDPHGALAPIFLLQTLAASSGFAVPARRGHYDLLLTSAVTRFHIGVAHLVASTCLGMASWLMLGVIEALTREGAASVSFTTGTIAALGVVSGLSWAVTVPLPRLTGAILWLLMFVAPIDHDVWPVPVRGVVLPWALVGRSLFSLGPVAVGVTAAVVCAAVLFALGWICRTDVSLQVAR